MFCAMWTTHVHADLAGGLRPDGLAELSKRLRRKSYIDFSEAVA
jgi:hypothetical protein